MPIGKLPQSQPMMGRKSSVNESCSLESTIDSRMSHSELLPMELLKVNYVHQCKQAMMRKSNEPPIQPHLNNPARFIGYRRQAPTQVSRPMRSSNAPLSPNSARKPLPPIPPPTVESWLLLSKQATPQPTATTTTTDSDCCCSQSACSCSDSNSDVTETSTVTPDCEKSQSWNYRDGRRAANPNPNINPNPNSNGIKSRADRIARIERAHCEPPTSSSAQDSSPDCVACLRQPGFTAGFASSNRMTTRSRIPKPMVQRNDAGAYSEKNAQLQRRVQQLFQQDAAVQSHSEAPRWMFQKAGGAATRQPEPGQAAEQQSPRLQQQRDRAKLERVHVRKKRQTLQIVNQLTAERTREAFQDGSSYRPQLKQSTTMAREDRMKRLSLECCSDSGVSSSNDTKEQQTKQNNMQRDEKCLDCVETVEKQNLKHADPNDVQNFAKKNLTKATTNEILTAAAVKAKQCNIEREKKLNILNQRSEPMTSTSITIGVDESWVQESCIDPCDDYMETDSLMLPPPQAIRHSSNSVKIFVSSDEKATKSSSPCTVDLSSRNSMSSSGCGGSSRDTSSLCDSEQDCCLCFQGNPRGSSISCASNDDCCHAIGGVFWNNACYELETDLGPSCCCSLSSCDEDNCSYYDGKFSIELEGIPGRSSKVPLRNNKLLRKVGIP